MKIDNFKIEEWFNKYEKSAKYNLADTCVDSLTINELLKLTNNDIEELFNRKMNYGDVFGSTRLKNAICSMYENQSINNITITHGTIGANHLVIMGLVEQNDKVVSVIPTYQQHYSIPKAFGGNVFTYRLKEENNWLPDLKEFEKLVGNDTKLICLNNPNNPTGVVIPDDMLVEIVNIAQKSNAYILCDEVYRGLNHEGNPFSKSIADLYDKGISTSSTSKVFSLAGLRLGWIVANKKIIDLINHHREYNTISVGILDDYFASLAIENKDKIIKRNLSKIIEGKQILLDWIKTDNRFSVVTPNGGTTAFVKFYFVDTSTNLCKNLQDETGVMILPGETLEYDKYLRIGYGNNFNDLKIALNLLSKYVDNNY